jgi:hypothetical protein
MQFLPLSRGNRDKLTAKLVSLLESWAGLCQVMFTYGELPSENSLRRFIALRQIFLRYLLLSCYA